MAGRDPREAFHNFIDPMNRALNCVADGRLSVSGGIGDLATNWDYSVTTARRRDDPTSGEGDPVTLIGPSNLRLGIRQTILIVAAEGERGPYKVETRAYSYRFLADSGEGHREVLAFHWNLDSVGTPHHPHLHVGSPVVSGSSFYPGTFNKLHIPTGRLSLEAVLMFAINEMAVEPTHGRARALVLDVLREGDRVFRQWSTNHGDWY